MSTIFIMSDHSTKKNSFSFAITTVDAPYCAAVGNENCQHAII